MVFEDPGGWLVGTVPPERGPVGQALEFVGVLPDTSTEHLIKRLIGMPGDHVVCCDTQGRITVNDAPLDETSYLYRDSGRELVAIRRRSASTSSCRPTGSSCSATTAAQAATRAATSTTRRPAQMKGENAFVSLDLVVGRADRGGLAARRCAPAADPATYAGVPAAGRAGTRSAR